MLCLFNVFQEKPKRGFDALLEINPKRPNIYCTIRVPKGWDKKTAVKDQSKVVRSIIIKSFLKRIKNCISTLLPWMIYIT